MSTARTRGPRRRADAGQKRVSAKGIEYTACGFGMKVQTLLFPTDAFTVRAAERWARAHGFRVRKVDVTTNYVRIQQEPVALFVKGSFRTFPISDERRIRSVIGCPKLAMVRGGAVTRAKAPSVRQRRAA